MNETELNELYETLGNGIVKLFEQSEAGGDDASLNKARLLFLALSSYLEEHGILDAMNHYAHYAANSQDYPKSKPEKLPVA